MNREPGEIHWLPPVEKVPANPHRLIKIREGLYVAASAIVMVEAAEEEAMVIVEYNVGKVMGEDHYCYDTYEEACKEVARIVAEVNLPHVHAVVWNRRDVPVQTSVTSAAPETQETYPPIGYWPPDWLKKIPGDFDKFETIDTGSELPVEVIPPGQVMVFNVFPGVRLVNDSDKPLYVHAVTLSQPKD